MLRHLRVGLPRASCRSLRGRQAQGHFSTRSPGDDRAVGSSHQTESKAQWNQGLEEGPISARKRQPALLAHLFSSFYFKPSNAWQQLRRVLLASNQREGWGTHPQYMT